MKTKTIDVTCAFCGEILNTIKEVRKHFLKESNCYERLQKYKEGLK